MTLGRRSVKALDQSAPASERLAGAMEMTKRISRLLRSHWLGADPVKVASPMNRLLGTPTAVRFWEQNGSGDGGSGCLRRGDRDYS